MKPRVIKLLCLIAFFCVNFYTTDAQQEAEDTTNNVLVKYSPDFRFKDGVYLNFDQVKSNNPVPKYKIISSNDFNDPQFFDALATESVISYYDNLGIRQDIAMKNVWGFSKNGLLYVRMRQSFNKINIVGNICHFVATIIVQNNNYDPYYYNPYYYHYRNPGLSSTTNEIRQFILDFENGKILDYDTNNLEALFMKDPELHDEYMGLSKKKRQQLKFLYIRKFNERNPLLIPNS